MSIRQGGSRAQDIVTDIICITHSTNEGIVCFSLGLREAGNNSNIRDSQDFQDTQGNLQVQILHPKVAIITRAFSDDRFKLLMSLSLALYINV